MRDYQHDGGRLIVTKQLGSYRIDLAATNIRQERTGVHARVDIIINGVTLAYSTFNVERDEDRTRLANSGFKGYRENGLSTDYPVAYLKKDLDLFCDGLWTEQLKMFMPESMSGGVSSRPTFLLEPFVLAGGGTILFAPPGRGKSWSALLMAVAIDAGVNTSIWSTRQAPVLLLNLERSRLSYEGRLGAVNVALGLPRDRPLPILNARGRALTEVYGACERWVEEHATACVVVDSLSRAGVGDMNDNQVGNKAMDLLNRLSPTWLAPAHAPRHDDTHVFGSQMFDAAADVIVQVLSQQDDDGPLGVGLKITKVNDFRPPPIQVLAYEFDEASLVGIRRAKPGEFPEIEGERRRSLLHDVEEFIRDQDKAVATATMIGEALGRDRTAISRLLTNRKDRFVAVMKDGRNVFYGLVGRPGK